MEDSTADDSLSRLFKAHPLLFEGQGRAPANSDLPPGWFDLVNRLCSDLERQLGPEVAAQITVQQIKEKFGTLRFYAQLGDSRRVHVDLLDGHRINTIVVDTVATSSDLSPPGAIRDRLFSLIDAACEASGSICERCGSQGALRPLGWRRTLCDEHYQAARLARG